MLLKTRKPMIADNNTRRRRQPCVITVNGSAATSEPAAYRVTNCPAMAGLIRSPVLIWGSNPAGSVSVRMATKPVKASASRAATGSLSAADADRLPIGQVSVIVIGEFVISGSIGL